MRADDVLRGAAVPVEWTPPPSPRRFPDQADFRIEISSVEGTSALRAVLAESRARKVTINRVSQGSGAMLLPEAEIKEFARIGHDEGLEVSLFVGPREEWGTGAMVRSAEGATLSGRIRGTRQLRYAVEDVLRAVECGIRGFLVADIGLLQILTGAQRHGDLPTDVIWKVSALLAPSNPAAVVVLTGLGASTLNLPTDVTLLELAELRAVTDVPLDLYVEAPDSLGGSVRIEQTADLIAVGAPLYVKLGLRNSRGLYPAGAHLEREVKLIAVEKVRRAATAIEWLGRAGSVAVQSAPGAAGLGIPQP